GSPGLGVMRANPQPGLTSHSGHSRGPDKPAVVIQIRLDYIHHVVLNHPLEEPSTGILLTEGYFHIECVGNFFGVALLFPWTRLFEPEVFHFLEPLSNLNALCRAVAAVSVGH